MTKLFKMTEEEFRQVRIAYINTESILKGSLENELLKIFDKGFNALVPVENITEDMHYIEYKGRYIAALKSDKDYEYVNGGSKLRVYTSDRLLHIFNPHHSYYDDFAEDRFTSERLKMSWLDKNDNDYYIIDGYTETALYLAKDCEDINALYKKLDSELLEKGFVDFEVWEDATEDDIETLEWNNLD